MVTYPLSTFLNVPETRTLRLVDLQAPVELPKDHITDLSMIPAWFQAQYPTCCPHAYSTIRTKKHHKITGELKPYSRRFISAQTIKTTHQPLTTQGFFPLDISKTAKTVGIAREAIGLDNDPTANYAEYVSLPITKQMLDDAFSGRMNGYAEVDARSLEALKQAIFQNDLVEITIGVDWNCWLSTGHVVAKPKNVAGLHRIVLFGWMTLDTGDTMFLFRNSWGKDWGILGDGNFLWSEQNENIFDALAWPDNITPEMVAEVKAKPYVYSRDLTLGSMGNDVLQLQKYLASKDYFQNSQFTNYFGDVTLKSLTNYQKDSGINPTGYFGPITRMLVNKHKMTLEDAIVQVESGGFLMAVGDKDIPDSQGGKAYGPMQIRQPVCDDVNKAFGTKYRAADCLGNLPLSVQIFHSYMDLWATPKNIGRAPTDEDRARIWNGGPSGWQRDATKKYWVRVSAYL